MAKDITLKTRNGETRYPKSVTALIYENGTGKTLQTIIEEMRQVDSATDTRTQHFKADVNNLDTLKNKTDIGLYNYVGTGWRGSVSVCYDSADNVSQVALSSSTPSYNGNTLTWLSAQPCAMARTYTNGAWSHWEKVGAPVVNDLTTGGTDKALSAEMGKTLKEGLDALGPKIDQIDQFPVAVKMKILECFRAVAWASPSGETLVDELEALFGRHGNVISISCTYTPTKTIYAYDSLDELKSNLVVEAVYQDNTKVEVGSYTLSGVLNIGESTISVTYGEFTATFVAIISDYPSSLSLTDGSVIMTDYPSGLFDGVLGFGNNDGRGRRSFLSEKGTTLPFMSFESSHQSPYIPYIYPISVPTTATMVNVSITPSTFQIAPSIYSYDETTGKYTLVANAGGWVTGSSTVEFPAGANYLTVVAKNANGTTITTDPTELTINFS